MRPALSFSSRRAKPSNCLLKQCEIERNKRSFLTCATKTTPTTAKRPQLPALWFLVTRSSSSQASLKQVKNTENATKKFHPRSMNKETNLDSLLLFLSTCSLTPKEIFKSLRTALYNTTQYDSKKAWLIYQSMVHYQVDKYLKPNNYGFLLCVLKYGDSVPQMLTVLENMKSHPGEDSFPSAYHLSQVLFAMSRYGLVQEACDIVRLTTAKADSSGNIDSYPTANHYHSLVIALKNSKSIDSKAIESVSKLMVDGMEKRDILLHNSTLSTMLSLFSSQQQSKLQFLKAMDLVNSKNQHTQKSHPYNEYIYTSLISGFARQGDSESAKRLFDEMKKHKIPPNQVTFAALMEAYSKAGDFTSAIRLLTDHQRRYRKLSNHMVTSLLVNAIRHNNLTVAENTAKFVACKKMKIKDMDNMTRTALIWLKTKQNVDDARKKFDELYELDKDLVNHIMTNHLVIGYGLKNDKENVIKSYNLNRKMRPATTAEQMRSNHHLTNALFHCRDVPAALGVFASMRSQDIPDDVTLAMVIQGLILNNENNLAWRLFKTLQSDGIEPNLHAYTSVLKLLGHRDVDIKKKQNDVGVDSDLALSAGIRSPSLDYLHSTVPSTTEALSLFRRMTGFQQPNVYTYTTLISCFAKYNISRAISIFDHMCATGVSPTVETYTSILQGCAIFRNSQMALSVFNHMCESRIEPNAVTWRYLLKSLLRSRIDKSQIDKIAEMAKKALDKKVD